MTVRIHPHARERMAERGAIEDEITTTVEGGEQFPARFGRAGYRRRSQRNSCHYDLHILLLARVTMKISYDAEVDALYIRLAEGKHECRTVRLNEEVALNIGEGEELVGIEILDAGSPWV